MDGMLDSLRLFVQTSGRRTDASGVEDAAAFAQAWVGVIRSACVVRRTRRPRHPTLGRTDAAALFRLIRVTL